MVIGATPLCASALRSISLVAVSTGFLMHELMHKFVAQRYGAWAEFRVFPLGLMMAILFSFFGLRVRGSRRGVHPGKADAEAGRTGQHRRDRASIWSSAG